MNDRKTRTKNPRATLAQSLSEADLTCFERAALKQIQDAIGQTPTNLADWFHVAGKLDIAVLSVERDGFRGGMSHGIILLPRDADEHECMRVMAHELAEFCVRQAGHAAARHIECFLYGPVETDGNSDRGTKP